MFNVDLLFVEILRLIVAAVQACGIARLNDAPGWKIHIASGDSLLLGKRWDQAGRDKGERLIGCRVLDRIANRRDH